MEESNSDRNAGAQDIVLKTLERVLRPRFRFNSTKVEAKEETEYKETLAEAYAAVKRRIEDPDLEQVEDIEAFTAMVAHNTFKRFLKKKYPMRHKLAVEIRTILELDARLAFWTILRAPIGGKSAWKGEPAQLKGKAKLALEDAGRAARECFRNRHPGSLPVPDLLLEFFDWLRHPFGYDHTVNFCFSALGLREAEMTPLLPDGPEHIEVGSRSEDSANARELAEFIWAQVLTLDPVRKGIFLLFEPPGENQEAICDQLILLGACTLSDVADAAELTIEQLSEVRRQARVTYEVVASLYSISAKQAENIRRGVTDLIWRRLIANGFRQEAGSAK